MVSTWEDGDNSVEFVDNMLNWFYEDWQIDLNSRADPFSDEDFESSEEETQSQIVLDVRVLSREGFSFSASRMQVPADCHFDLDPDDFTLMFCFNSSSDLSFKVKCWRGFPFSESLEPYLATDGDYSVPAGVYHFRFPNDVLESYANALFEFQEVSHSDSEAEDDLDSGSSDEET